MSIDKFISMTEVLAYIKMEDVSDLEERAEIIQAFLDKQANQGIGNAYDRYLGDGAATSADVITPYP